MPRFTPIALATLTACTLALTAGGAAQAAVEAATPTGPYTNGPVFAIVRAGDGSIYVGGDFTQVCTTTTTCENRPRIAHIAANGSILPALGAATATPDNDVNGPVRALAINGSDLYAGGDFSRMGGIGIGGGIARWDGSEWHSLKTGLDGPVYAIGVSGGNVYAGGKFATSGGNPLGGIARWDGENWFPMGLGSNGPVYAIAEGPGGLYAGGAFSDMIGAVGTARIARWDGSAWQSVGGGMTGFYDEVHALAASGPNLYVGGGITTAGGEAHNIARWDGTAWTALGAGPDNQVQALAVAGPALYAGGDFLAFRPTFASRIAHWDGTIWNALGAGADAAVHALAISPDGSSLYAGGSFNRIAGVAHPNLAAFAAAVAADRTAPKLTAVVGKQRLGNVLKKGLRVKVTVGEALPVAVRATVRGRRMGEVIKKLKGGVVTSVTLKLTASSVRRLRHALRVPFTITASAVDRAGNRGNTSVTLTLRR